MKVGEIEITPMSDGFVRLPPEYFRNADWSVHRDLLGPDGNLEIPVGTFLVRTGALTVLIDAGLGPVDAGFMKGGDLPGRLEEAGTSPSEIDLVVCTHLHVDHVGWLAQDGAPFFKNATVRFGAADWDHFVENNAASEAVRDKMEVLKEAGRIEVIESDSTVAPGIDTLQAPGHTPGHLCLVVASGEERAFLLGDAVTCPIQLEEPEWEAISDVDASLASRTRESLWRELETSGNVAVAAHFPGLQFGRVMAGKGRRYFS